MDKKVEDLINLNYRLISFIETILSKEEKCIKKGKYLYMQSLFQKEFNDILQICQNGGGVSCPNFLIFSGNEYYPSGGWKDFYKKAKTLEEALKYYEKGIEDYGWSQIVDMKHGEMVYDSWSGTETRKYVEKGGGYDVKRLGKELGLKPPKNKKTLSKADITKKILANEKLHNRALKSLNK